MNEALIQAKRRLYAVLLALPKAVLSTVELDDLMFTLASDPDVQAGLHEDEE